MACRNVSPHDWVFSTLRCLPYPGEPITILPSFSALHLEGTGLIWRQVTCSMQCAEEIPVDRTMGDPFVGEKFDVCSLVMHDRFRHFPPAIISRVLKVMALIHRVD
jgi:hypothetical protein